MQHAPILERIFADCGVYRAGARFAGAELNTVAAELDRLFLKIESLETESLPTTARGLGLEQWGALLGLKPAAGSTEELRASILALLGIHGFTLADMNAGLGGCGLPAEVREAGTPGVVEVSFPGTAGIPADFDRLKAVIEEILPCHLEIRYAFWFMTWEEWEKLFLTFENLDRSGLSWADIETHVRL